MGLPKIWDHDLFETFKIVVHFSYHFIGFMMLNFTSTLTSLAATPLFNCWRTLSAYQSWYLSAMKHLALLFTEVSKGWNRFVWLFRTCVARVSQWYHSFSANHLQDSSTLQTHQISATLLHYQVASKPSVYS